ncbi:MAG TPA: ergothioneine biosynthesis protein EgtB [Polyangia bacterium]|nr:ergothioneine biosynthesis protein EgtB [Polyangia bacterium]
MRLLDDYRNVRARTVALAAPLSAEDQMVQTMAEASPTKWHLAHTTWFFETFVLGPFVAGYQPVDAHYGFLFNSYYEGVGPRVERARRGELSRPALAEVQDYRRRVDTAMERVLGTELPAAAAATVVLGLHHEQQHQELLLTDAKHALGTQPLRPAYQPPAPAPTPAAPRPAQFRRFEAGVVSVGHAGDGFAFDNEGPRHRHFLEAFALADRPVTCAEYLAFMRDGGYARPELWLSDGWQRVQAERWRAPLYWEERDGAWHLYTLGGVRPIDPAEVVAHVSYYEADAFARWAGARLPTEEEWEHAAAGAPLTGHFADAGRYHPGPAAPGAAFGNVWQWTQSAYLAYPGFRPPAGAIGEYNGKFMSGQMVLRGGSCFTPAGHIRATYRNFFPPETRWQMSGLRLARDT